ncbi:MAG: sigma-70 family RNA polymerase sigma factor [Prevotellaceae bacterium]|nr:sigma-70 family RNA polymerase sigma factor [Prevotellaceae bacterium]
MEHGKFEQFFRANYQKAYYLALRLLHDEEASRDVVSDSFEKVLGKMEEEQLNVNNPESYLLMVVRNMALEYLRRQQLHNRYAKMEIHHLERNSPDEQTVMEREQKMAELTKAIEKLTPQTQRIVNLCYVERKKYREVAAELDISESAVKKHIMQALSFLRQKFKNTDL